MKKIIIVIILLITGCSEITVKECRYEKNDINIKINTVYEIKYKDDNVLEYNNKTTYTFKNKDDMKNAFLDFSRYKDLKYYKKTKKIKDNILIIETNINFKKIDLEQFSKVESIYSPMYNAIEDLKVTPEELISNMSNETCTVK